MLTILIFAAIVLALIIIRLTKKVKYDLTKTYDNKYHIYRTVSYLCIDWCGEEIDGFDNSCEDSAMDKYRELNNV